METHLPKKGGTASPHFATHFAVTRAPILAAAEHLFIAQSQKRWYYLSAQWLCGDVLL